MTKTKTKESKIPYRQCVMRLAAEDAGQAVVEYVAWLPASKVTINKHVRIDGLPGRWLIVSAGDARPEYVADAYAANARAGFPSVSGHEKFKEGN